MISLDARLLACADFVSGKVACDVGTDHAYLAVYLVEAKICERVIASDINDGPLQFGRKTVEKYGYQDKIKLVKSDGLKEIDSDGITDVIIAGMGAETICQIIGDAEWLRDGVNLVLQPMTKSHVLREWLYSNGFEINREQAVVEENFAYSVISSTYSGVKKEINSFDAYTGKLDFSKNQSKLYLAVQAKRLKIEGVGLLNSSTGAVLGRKKIELAKKITNVVKRGYTMITVKDIYDYLNELAPFAFTDKFDNTGLLIGDFNEEITKILLALDITSDITDEALNRDFDLIISHHPVIFNPIKRLDNDNPACRLVRYLINAIALHTNLDMANGGISDIMAELLGLENTGEILEPVHKNPYKQVVVFVPKENVNKVYDAMTKAGAGEIGYYKGCSFSVNGEGCFQPIKGANPHKGAVGKLEKVEEVRLEMLVSPSKLKAVIKAMVDAHPYEEPAYQILDNHAIYEEIGYGRICELEEEIDAKTLAEKVKQAYNCSVVRYVDGEKPIKRVALCSGSGGGNYELAYQKGVDAYITGDIKHDQWIGANNLGLTLIDGGHFHTENIVLQYLQKKIKKRFPSIKVEIAKFNFDVVKYIV